uniref:CBM20 domain-containing protein n=1 Tax=Chromera velia CCMP2878 TaxID=1169474 RepID=A0A0G4GVF0_9ALVE|eukprot:Cvel_23550.t1-p1 / transcript=Cvel_23550.t1 / gene=Cvel_23550 / organism=Chromera_velia_CCMP2878 / gene_product=hypothetical protein / transcript_product=hypothetical protein / location=Cvel_scaffold2439:20795-25635(+) / protein_length=1004 / sequence_SO=supercontig / SO=protein_coding / is_pseudo=false
MLKFRIIAHTNFGEQIGICGSTKAFGNWDWKKCLMLKTDGNSFPLWYTDRALDFFGAEAVEYKYLKVRDDGSMDWENMGGANRFVPADALKGRGIGTPSVIILDDGGFGYIQPVPKAVFEASAEYPEEAIEKLYRFPAGSHEPSGPSGLKIAIIGSSVAAGYDAWLRKGWVFSFARDVRKKFGHHVINVSQSGANVRTTRDRFVSVISPVKPDVVIIALSLGNEGIAHCDPHHRPACQRAFEVGVEELVRMTKKEGAVPVLGGVYPNGSYTKDHRSFVLSTQKKMQEMGAAFYFDWLGGLDRGDGKWKVGINFDDAHPNSEGHRLMFEQIPLQEFNDAIQSACLEANTPTIRAKKEQRRKQVADTKPSPEKGKGIVTANGGHTRKPAPTRPPQVARQVSPATPKSEIVSEISSPRLPPVTRPRSISHVPPKQGDKDAKGNPLLVDSTRRLSLGGGRQGGGGGARERAQTDVQVAEGVTPSTSALSATSELQSKQALPLGPVDGQLEKERGGGSSQGPTATPTSTSAPEELPAAVRFVDASGFFTVSGFPSDRLVVVENRSQHTYAVHPAWKELQRAFVAGFERMPAGLYIRPEAEPAFVEGGGETGSSSSSSGSSSFGGDFGKPVCFSVNEKGELASEAKIPPLSVSRFEFGEKFYGQCAEILFFDGKLGILREKDGSVRVINEAESEYNIQPMWKEVQGCMAGVPEGVYEDSEYVHMENSEAPQFSTLFIDKDGLQSRVKAPPHSCRVYTRVSDLHDRSRCVIIPLGDRCSARMLLHKLEWDGPCFPFDLTRTTQLSDIADMIRCDFWGMVDPESLWYDWEHGRYRHTKWTGLSFAHEVEEGEDPSNEEDQKKIFQRMESRYTSRIARFWYAVHCSDEVLFLRTGSSTREEVENLIEVFGEKCSASRRVRLMLISGQEDSVFEGIPGVVHFNHVFDPDRMAAEKGHWEWETKNFEGMMKVAKLTTRNLYWTPNKPPGGRGTGREIYLRLASATDLSRRLGRDV